MLNSTNKAIVAYRVAATKEFNNLCNIANQKLGNRQHARELVIDSIVEYYIRNSKFKLLNVKRGLTDYVSSNLENYFLPKEGRRQLEAFDKFLAFAFTDITALPPPSVLVADIARRTLSIFYSIYFLEISSEAIMDMYSIEADELHLYYKMAIDLCSQILIGVALK